MKLQNLAIFCKGKKIANRLLFMFSQLKANNISGPLLSNSLLYKMFGEKIKKFF